jgi:FkbM family methyltransferase
MPLTRDHIIWAYRILLDRDPESDAAIQPKLAGCETTQQLRADMTTSQEYRDKNPDFAHSNDRTIVIREFEGGLRLFVDLSDHAIGLPIVRGHYERGELGFVRRTLRPGDHAIDLGAHYGFFAVHMAAIVGPRGTVTAFEPFEENAALLERSIRENRFEGRLRLERAAVSRASGQAALAFATETLNSGGAFVATANHVPGHAVRQVRAVALDDLDLPRPIAFIKMDVEGAEPLAVEGAATLLNTDRPTILSELHGPQLARVSGKTVEAFLSDLRAMDYRVFRLEDDRRGAEVLSPPSEPICSVVMLPRER